MLLLLLLREEKLSRLHLDPRLWVFATTFFQVTLPGAVPVIFSGLRLGLIYALLGVIGAEIIASEKGLGQWLAYLSSTFDINGVMALLLVLALLGVAIVRLMTWLEKRLLHWQ